ncbi:unnamed protein product [Ceratitis capitata]|uniref:(Mediterranean fruit fly) hypothetical protein n=1 Tax=Ceratitis capitata TaxID=7213 RepID=A0A811UCD4_CERCA|nr:unnamed protein product [Ceratitis capitata]
MDVGHKTSKLIIDKLASIKCDKEVEHNVVTHQLINEIEAMLSPVMQPLILNKKPHIIMVCGVNGSGKTTTIGKLAYKYKKMGKSIVLVACDTFRAAASEQLNIWAERSGCPIVIGEYGSDSASLAYRAVSQAIKDNIDVVLIDTAGRLQNNVNLMEELSKYIEHQLEAFSKMVSVTGLIITKLDGTAKGGVVIGLAETYKVKLLAIGIGESIEDLKEFTGKEFAKALFNCD